MAHNRDCGKQRAGQRICAASEEYLSRVYTRPQLRIENLFPSFVLGVDYRPMLTRLYAVIGERQLITECDYLTKALRLNEKIAVVPASTQG